MTNSITQIEKVLNDEAEELINIIIAVGELEVPNDDVQVFSLEFIRDIMYLYKPDKKDHILKLITTWKMASAVKEGRIKDGRYEHLLTRRELRNLLSGKYLKDEMLFDSHELNKKRDDIEEYSKLFILLGGTEKGLSVENIAKWLSTADAFSVNPKGTIRGEFKNDEKNFVEEAKEIIKVLASDKDYLTIKDFINIMTRSMSFPSDLSRISFKG